MNTIFKKIILFLLFSINLINIGCEPTLFIGPIVTGVTYWIQGESHRYYEEPKEILFKSFKHVLQDQNLKIYKNYLDQKSGVYYISAGERNRFSIKIQTIEGLTRVSIRINTFGDKAYTESLYTRLDKEVKKIHFDENGDPVIN